MKSRERVLKTVMFEEPDRVPIFEIPPSLKVLSQIFNEDLANLLALFAGVDGRTSEETWRKLIKMYKQIGLDCFCTSGIGNPFKAIPLEDHKVVDVWGRIFSLAHGFTTSPFYVGPYLTSREKYEAFPRPDPLDEYNLNQLKSAIKAAGDDMLVIAGIGSIWEVQGEALGFDNALKYIYTDPVFLRKVLDDSTRYAIELGKASIDLGAEILLLWDDYAYRHGPMMSPKHWKEFIYPCLKRVADGFHKRGAFLMIHSDGNIRPLMDMIIEAGVDLIQPLEPAAGMDIIEVAEKWGGKICLVGNIDVSHLLPFGTREDVIKSVKRAISAAAPGGGYILGSGHMINDACKPENFLAMVETGKKFGKYPVKLA